jgi:hypothetical protein
MYQFSLKAFKVVFSKAIERASDWAADFKKVIQSYFAKKIWKYILWAVQLKIYILNLKIYLKFKRLTVCSV